MVEKFMVSVGHHENLENDMTESWKINGRGAEKVKASEFVDCISKLLKKFVEFLKLSKTH